MWSWGHHNIQQHQISAFSQTRSFLSSFFFFSVSPSWASFGCRFFLLAGWHCASSLHAESSALKVLFRLHNSSPDAIVSPGFRVTRPLHPEIYIPLQSQLSQSAPPLIHELKWRRTPTQSVNNTYSRTLVSVCLVKVVNPLHTNKSSHQVLAAKTLKINCAKVKMDK